MTRRLLVLLTLAILLFASACESRVEETPVPPFKILAGSELKDMESILRDVEYETGVGLLIEYTGALDGADRVAKGEDFDAVWFANGAYLDLQPSAANRVLSQEQIMFSPVVLGVKESKAKAWGWIPQEQAAQDVSGVLTVTWNEIVEKAAQGELRYAMSKPSASDSGFVALLGVMAALSGKADPLTASDAEAASEELNGFFNGQAATTNSSWPLIDLYVKEQERLDGIINYESLLLGLNKSGKLVEPLVLVYPKEGIITADYPLALLNESRSDDYQRLTKVLLSEEIQRRLMTRTMRRPAVLGIELLSAFPKETLVELPFPNSREAVDRLRFTAQSVQVRPAHTIFVIQRSKSMEGQPLADLKTAMKALAGVDADTTQFLNHEKITVIAFNHEVSPQQDFVVNLDRPETLEKISKYVDGLTAGGNTATYDALLKAYEVAAASHQEDPGRAVSIILLSGDRSRGTGIEREDFLASYHAMEGVEKVPTFGIVFGESLPEDIERIAKSTGGQVFVASAQPLPRIFLEIREIQGKLEKP